MKKFKALLLIVVLGYGLLIAGENTKVEAASWSGFVDWFFGQPNCKSKLKYDSKGYIVPATYCPNVVKGEMPAGPGSVKGMAGIIAKSTFVRSTSSGTKIYSTRGSYSTAVSDFNNLKPKVTKNTTDLKVGKLNDGTAVNVRKKSTDGRPTLEFYNGKRSTKIRYDQ